MKKYGIPTAEYETFDDADEAAGLHPRTAGKYPLVVKADGLALGKGVLICEDEAAAQAAVQSIMEDRQFGASGSRVVVEEFLTGPEVSVLSFTDGKTVVPMVSSMDHKRALDGDRGLNTGGMGTIAPNPYYTPRDCTACAWRRSSCPPLRAMTRGGPPLQGLPVLRADAHPGRPEGHRVQLPLRRPGDPGGAAAAGKRPAGRDAGHHQRHAGADVEVKFSGQGRRAAWCWPQAATRSTMKKAKPITGLADGQLPGGEAIVYHAGTGPAGRMRSSPAGGRVLGVTATADTLLTGAWTRPTRAADQIGFEGLHQPRGHRQHAPWRAVSHREDNVMVYRIYVEKRPEYARGGQGHLARDPHICCASKA